MLRNTKIRTLALIGCLLPITSTSAALTTPDIIRFLEQSSWGPTMATIAEVQQAGSFQTFLANQFNSNISSYPTIPPSPNSSIQCPTGSATNCYISYYTQYPNQNAFFQNALFNDDQLRQRVAFALHEILMVSGASSQQPGVIAAYLNLLMNDAFVNYRQILNDISLNPAMGQYLNSVNNIKPNFQSISNSNENYAREVLQLFSIGVNWLNIDGTLMLAANGQPIPTYDQETVKGFAHVFTGWVYADPGKTTASKFWNPANFVDPMVLYLDANGIDTYHDKSAKTLLRLSATGKPVTLPANQNGTVDLTQALDNIFNHPNVGPFIGKQLIQHLVTSNPSPSYVKRVATAFNTGLSNGFGSGKRGDMQAVIAAILLDTEARGDTKTSANYGRLREPVQLMLNALRPLNPTSDGVLTDYAMIMGQQLFYAPTVFGYYPHIWTIAGTTLEGPEFAIDSNTQALFRETFISTMLYGNLFPGSATTGTQVDLSSFTAAASNPANLITLLNKIFLHNTMSSTMKTLLTNELNSIPATNLQYRAQVGLYMVLSSGQYQVQR